MQILQRKILLLTLLAITCFATNEKVFAQKKQFTVVIDPGHGGKDPGAIGSNSKEKDIVLSVGKTLGYLIEKNHPDVKVKYTRNSDHFVTLNRRADIANKAHADLFISLHCNALDRKKASPQGVETFVLGLHRSKDNLDVAKTENAVIFYEEDYSTKYGGFNPNETESYIIFEYMSGQYLQQSINFATSVQDKLVKNSKRTNRNVRQAGFLVLREVAMPSVLVELGYISNRNDENFLKSNSGQQSLANSIYLAFNEYKRDYDKKNHILTNVSKKENVIATNKSQSGETEYKVQFLISQKKLESNSQLFKGLSPVDFYIDGSTYKYTYGNTNRPEEIEAILKQVRELFKDAFIVEFKNGKRIK